MVFFVMNVELVHFGQILTWDPDISLYFFDGCAELPVEHVGSLAFFCWGFFDAGSPSHDSSIGFPLGDVVLVPRGVG